MAIFFIIIFIIAVQFILISSHLKIDIKELNIINKKIIDLKIILSLSLFNKLDLLKIKIDKSKIKKLENSEKIEKIINELKERLLQDYKNVVDIKIKDIKQYLQVFKNIKINKLYIQATIGTEEAPITAYLVTIISLVITFFSARNIDNIYYQIFPEYRKGNYLNLTLKCIISTKIVHIINIARVLRLTKDSRDNKQLTNEKMYK